MKQAGLRPQAEMDLVQMASYYTKEVGGALGERAFNAAIDAQDVTSGGRDGVIAIGAALRH